MMKDWPRPNIKELPGLYSVLDMLVERVERLIRNLPEHLFDKEKEIVNFGKMSEEDLRKLIAQDPEVMIIAFTRVCGLSVREFFRVYGLKNVYGLCKSKWKGGKDEDIFTKSIMELLPYRMHLETFLYTFYKMWEEHQRRHYRAKFEELVRDFFRTNGYACEKVTHPIEVDGAIPPDEPHVVIQVRVGVRRDLVKRAKEFSTEREESAKHFPSSRFIVVFRIPPHELERREDIRKTILRHSRSPYDAVLFHDELERILKKFEEWQVPKKDKRY